MNNIRGLGTSLLAVLAITLAMPLAARADESSNMPLFSAQPMDHALVEIHGRVVDVRPYDLLVRDNNGVMFDVQFRQGTVVDPDAGALQSGQRVVVTGTSDGKVFAAQVVELPDSAQNKNAAWPINPQNPFDIQ